MIEAQSEKISFDKLKLRGRDLRDMIDHIHSKFESASFSLKFNKQQRYVYLSGSNIREVS